MFFICAGVKQCSQNQKRETAQYPFIHLPQSDGTLELSSALQPKAEARAKLWLVSSAICAIVDVQYAGG